MKPAIRQRRTNKKTTTSLTPLEFIKFHGKRCLAWWSRRRLWQKIIIIIITIVMTWVGGLYGGAMWYKNRHKNEPMKLGVTFIASYARNYDLDPQETMAAMIDDLGVKHFRLVSYWDVHEPQEDVYNFDELDWQFAMADKAGAKVSLAIGLRQPRWPECHMPKWAEGMEKDEWYPLLKKYMKVVIERYQSHPALESYQLENEFFMDVFGICPDFDRNRLIDEYAYVKQLDPNHPVIISRSNNAIGLPIGNPRPDQFGISVYKRVWDKSITKDYFEYPFPGWFYGALAGWGEIVTGRSMMIHELQAEPWAPGPTKDATFEEQNKSMDAVRLRHRINYGKSSGMRSMDLWGAEWWYWRKVHFKDETVWNTAKEEFKKVEQENAALRSQ